MFGSTVLEVAIGLALVFLLMSALCSALQEFIAGVFSWRSATLKLGIERLLRDQGLAGRIQRHPLVISSGKSDGSFPSYLSAGTFTLALLDELGQAPATPAAVPPELGGGVAGFVAPAAAPPGAAAPAALTPASQLERIKAVLRESHSNSPLLALLSDSSIKDLDDARGAIARWFDEGMDRVSGWYKRRAQLLVIVTSVVATVVIDVDAIAIGRSLAASATLRAAVTATAESASKMGGPMSHMPPPMPPPMPGAPPAAFPVPPGPAIDETPLTKAPQIDRELLQLDLPVARWIDPKSGKLTGAVTLTSLLGWLITALAVSLGAPFWFDALGKLVNLRAGGPPPARAASKGDANAGS